MNICSEEEWRRTIQSYDESDLHFIPDLVYQEIGSWDYYGIDESPFSLGYVTQRYRHGFYENWTPKQFPNAECNG